MMLTRVMFRPIISQICARSPLYLKLFLSIFILQPMKTYVHWFRCFQMDVPIDHHICGRNFRQCGCWWLWISHILQGFVYWHCIFGIDENCSQLGFGRQLHYRSYDLIDIQYHSILGWEVVISQNKIITSHSTPCLQFVEIGRIDVDIKHHVACSIYEDGVRLCHWIIEELFLFIHCAIGGCWLFWSDCTQWRQHCPIDRPGIIQRCAVYFHVTCLSFLVEWFGIIEWCVILCIGSIICCYIWMGFVLHLGRIVVLETVKRFCRVSRNS